MIDIKYCILYRILFILYNIILIIPSIYYIIYHTYILYALCTLKKCYTIYIEK